MPLTSHGKIDRRNLPLPEGRIHQANEYVPPVGEVEEALATIWQEVLLTRQVGVLDPFFELGGHSLKLAKTMYLIQEQFHTEVTFRELFEHQTIRAQALLIKSKSRQQDTPIELFGGSGLLCSILRTKTALCSGAARAGQPQQPCVLGMALLR
ncbi:phosphopantetheine-binding protein [Paenibacillus rhizoplanae]